MTQYTIQTDELDEFKTVLNGPVYLSALQDIRENLRSKVKHCDYEHSETSKLIDIIYSEFNEILTLHNIDLYNL